MGHLGALPPPRGCGEQDAEATRAEPCRPHEPCEGENVAEKVAVWCREGEAAACQTHWRLLCAQEGRLEMQALWQPSEPASQAVLAVPSLALCSVALLPPWPPGCLGGITDDPTAAPHVPLSKAPGWCPAACGHSVSLHGSTPLPRGWWLGILADTPHCGLLAPSVPWAGVFSWGILGWGFSWRQDSHSSAALAAVWLGQREVKRPSRETQLHESHPHHRALPSSRVQHNHVTETSHVSNGGARPSCVSL